MKKKLMAIAAVFCCAMIMTMFTACGSDDDGGSPVDDRKPVAVDMSYAFSTTNDMLNIFDLTIEYYDANGTVQTELMTSTQWQKTLKPKIPATVGARLMAKVKAGVDVASMEKVTLSYAYEYNGSAVSSNNQVVGTIIGGGSGQNLTMAGSKVAEHLNKYKDGLVKYLYKYSSSGNAQEGSW